MEELHINKAYNSFFVYFRYMPIIPMVLVNGSEGIGTGWSSYIPNYNPRDIIANLRRLLKGDSMEPMDPWYRWFKGTIEKAAKETGNSYTVSGIIEEVNETTLKITELPLRRWTQDYKEFLESISSSNKESKDPLIEVNFTTYLRIMTSIKRCPSLYPISHENYAGCRILACIVTM
jgi:DNA gyrase/topoisomerase IV subunit A